MVKQYSSPTPFLGNDTYLCLDETSLWLDGGNYTSWYWFPDNEISRKIEVKKAGIYAIKVLDDNNCFGYDSIEIQNKCDLSIFIPNAFSPNGDGLNDSFQVFLNFEYKYLIAGVKKSLRALTIIQVGKANLRVMNTLLAFMFM